MRYTLNLSLFLFLSVFGNSSQAGIVVGGTRVVYDASKTEAILSVQNPDKHPYLIQSWIDASGPTGADKSSPKPPFVVTPPLFRLDAGAENLLRVIRLDGDIPEDRESVFWMNVKAIPATTQTDKNALQIAIKTRIKLFYRPAKLGMPSDEDYQTLVFHRQGSQLQVDNPSPWFITFYSLTVGGRLVDTTDMMVPPMGHANYPLPTSASGQEAIWQVINDFGGRSHTANTVIR